MHVNSVFAERDEMGQLVKVVSEASKKKPKNLLLPVLSLKGGHCTYVLH
jgi:hypothetical protein